ncbi:MAG: hypothetical protein L6416_01580 [Candidatus Omnitrophica bacterium]|nr:hypothetical protein [Candidatus Omnitrophota bacterium]
MKLLTVEMASGGVIIDESALSCYTTLEGVKIYVRVRARLSLARASASGGKSVLKDLTN